MFDNPISTLATFGALVVLAILLFGIGTFAKGGEFNRKHANRIMRWRLAAQFIAIVVVVGLVWLRSKG
ncbi:twin transmembrane helix small protein [Rhodobacter sp.]